jgi:hypothetical protein
MMSTMQPGVAQPVPSAPIPMTGQRPQAGGRAPVVAAVA